MSSAHLSWEHSSVLIPPDLVRAAGCTVIATCHEAMQACVCLCVCAYAMAHVIGPCVCIHACIKNALWLSTKALEHAQYLCDVIWVISLGRNLHHQEEGVTRCLRLRRWNATMAITVISAHIHLLQGSWFSPSFPPRSLSDIWTHTLHLPPSQNNLNKHTEYGGASLAHTCIHYISSDSNTKTRESAWAWQQTNQHEEIPGRLKRE